MERSFHFKRTAAVLTLLLWSVGLSQTPVWEPTNGPFGGEIRAFAINSTGHIFAAAYSGGVFRSTDNGGSWRHLGLRFINDLALNHSDDIFAASFGGVSRSMDGGETWEGLRVANTSGLDVNVVAINGNGDIFIGTVFEGMFRSRDNGETWTEINTGLTARSIYALTINTNGDLYAAMSQGVFRSTNSGDFWAPVNTGLPLSQALVSALATNSSGTVFAGTGLGMYRSTDDGNNWVEINERLADTWIKTLAVDSNDNLFAGSPDGIFLSTNAGDAWTEINNGLTTIDVLALAANADGGVFAGMNGGGVFTSGDLGENWAETNGGLAATTIRSIVLNSEGDLFAAQNGLGVFRYGDDGDTWQKVNTGLTTLAVQTLAVNSAGDLFVGTADGGIFRSANNAEVWVAINSGLTDLNVEALAENPVTHDLFAGTRSLGIFRSTDNGDTWAQTNNGLTNQDINTFAFNANGDVFAATDDGVFRSPDGETWEPENAGIEGIGIYVLAVNPAGDLFASTLFQGVYRSQDNGETWVKTGHPTASVNALAINSSGFIFSGLTGRPIYVSYDNGDTWGTASEGFFNLYAFTFAINADDRIFLGSGGNGVFRTTGSTRDLPFPTFAQITDSQIVNDGGDSRGGSWIDYDNDDDLDLFVTNSGKQNNFLYQNNADGTFTKITSGELVNDDSSSVGHCWGDYDNDGDLDLFVANTAGQNNNLYRNEGSGSFSKITNGEIVNDGGNSVGASWADYDLDGWLDLFVANEAGRNFLYRNNGSAGGSGEVTFEKITSGDIVTDFGSSSGGGWGDYDNDGDPDLFVPNQGGQNCFYENNGDGSFTKITTGAIVEDFQSSAGCSWGDYDNDGDLDLFVSNSRWNNYLYRNEGDRDFTLIEFAGGFSWGNSWGDFDNDGHLDLFVANGFGSDGQDNFLYLNDGDGSVTEMFSGAIVNDGTSSLGNCWGDFDSDGHLDLFVANGGEAGSNNLLFQNDGNDNNWISIRCVGTVSNAAAIGTKVRVKASIDATPVWQMREVSGQQGYASQNSLQAEFGLGDATEIDSIRIEWPSGIEQILTQVEVNRFITIREDSLATSVDGLEPGLPGQFTLSQNYPNPFNPATTIRYSLPQIARVSLKIFNLKGQEVAVLVDGNRNAGEHEVTWRTNGFPSGVYFYRLTASEPSNRAELFTNVRKLTLLK